MKQTILLVLFVIGSALQAQQDTIIELESIASASRDRLVIELNYTGWWDAPEPIDQKWYNRGINVYFTYDMPIAGSEHLSFSPGFGISSHNVYGNTSFALDTLDGVEFAVIENLDDRELNYDKAKINTNFFEIPLELRWRSTANKKDKRVKVAAGVRGGIMINNKLKYKGEAYDNLGNVKTVKTKDLKLEHFNSYRLGTNFRIGYGNVNLNMFYSLTELFQKDKGPKLVPFSVGISFNSF